MGEQLGIHPETLRNWVRQAEIDQGDRPGATTSDAERLAELEGDLEIAAAEYIDWFNQRRLHSEAGMIPLVERGHLPSLPDRAGDRRRGTCEPLANPG